MHIKTKDLIEIIDILKINIQQTFPDEVYVDEDDFYWQIKEDQLYNLEQTPDVDELGQLSDDWSDLLRLKKKDAIPISHDLNRLAAILQIVRKKSIGIW